jgi:hypothetical protein
LEFQSTSLRHAKKECPPSTPPAPASGRSPLGFGSVRPGHGWGSCAHAVLGARTRAGVPGQGLRLSGCHGKRCLGLEAEIVDVVGPVKFERVILLGCGGQNGTTAAGRPANTTKNAAGRLVLLFLIQYSVGSPCSGAVWSTYCLYLFLRCTYTYRRLKWAIKAATKISQ